MFGARSELAFKIGLPLLISQRDSFDFLLFDVLDHPQFIRIIILLQGKKLVRLRISEND
jgi:hypothetical protein